MFPFPLQIFRIEEGSADHIGGQGEGFRKEAGERVEFQSDDVTTGVRAEIGAETLHGIGKRDCIARTGSGRKQIARHICKPGQISIIARSAPEDKAKRDERLDVVRDQIERNPVRERRLLELQWPRGRSSDG